MRMMSDHNVKTRWVKINRTAAAGALCILFATDGLGQPDRNTMAFYEADSGRYLGKEVTVMISDAFRVDKGQHKEVAVFYISTKGSQTRSFTHAVVPLSEAEAFGRRYTTRDCVTVRRFRGTFSQAANNRFYLSVNGAKFPEDEITEAGQERTTAEQLEQPKLPAFDRSPLASFSYDGKRLIEARIVEITPSTVKLSDKNGLSLQVPIERAVKMPDLRIRAKAALEAAQAANSEGAADS